MSKTEENTLKQYRWINSNTSQKKNMHFFVFILGWNVPLTKLSVRFVVIIQVLDDIS